ncbi:phage minor capsid protein [Mechercharimyces sp. CAU 1602]|uniref:phage minor capsid protein n=1 Tax=Mechercharimyces sp. CAU 1602 TaxID=2973933 RepID=UPI0021633625|nr:phage minor capsid protein [Mechercharimyces sp. CAU 1602]MCS1350314.1 phage minor capsid protein [Mechercharimyces sp. CAU 1602]
MRQVPSPDFEYDVETLVSYYKDALRQIQLELERYDLTKYQRANQMALLKQLSDILSELNDKAMDWVEENIPKAARQGVVDTLYELGVVESVTEAERVMSFNRPNKEAVQAAVADMQTDLLAVTQNVERKVRAVVRQVAAEVMRENMTLGINGVKTIRSDLLTRLRNQLGNSADNALIDSAGRRWRLPTYTDMLARTKLSQVYLEAKTNEAVGRGAYLGIISSHAATDGCRWHENRIVKLSVSAPGNYPTVEELRATGQIFHPNCKHTITTLMSTDYLPQEVKEKAVRQAERGDKAIVTGKRNPKFIRTK